MEQTKTTEELFHELMKLSPQARNERVQSFFASRLEHTDMDEQALAIFHALMRSFDVSVKFKELDGGGDIFGSTPADIRDVRDGD